MLISVSHTKSCSVMLDVASVNISLIVSGENTESCKEQAKGTVIDILDELEGDAVVLEDDIVSMDLESYSDGSIVVQQYSSNLQISLPINQLCERIILLEDLCTSLDGVTLKNIVVSVSKKSYQKAIQGILSEAYEEALWEAKGILGCAGSSEDGLNACVVTVEDIGSEMTTEDLGVPDPTNPTRVQFFDSLMTLLSAPKTVTRKVTVSVNV